MICCEAFEAASQPCRTKEHTDHECPDTVIVRTKRGWGLSIKDGGASFYEMFFCPFCGRRLDSLLRLWSSRPLTAVFWACFAGGVLVMVLALIDLALKLRR